VLARFAIALGVALQTRLRIGFFSVGAPSHLRFAAIAAFDRILPLSQSPMLVTRPCCIDGLTAARTRWCCSQKGLAKNNRSNFAQADQL